MDKEWNDAFGSPLEVGDEVAFASTVQYLGRGTILRFSKKMVTIKAGEWEDHLGVAHNITVHKYPYSVVKHNVG